MEYLFVKADPLRSFHVFLSQSILQRVIKDSLQVVHSHDRYEAGDR
jgi:hypothetical protein